MSIHACAPTRILDIGSWTDTAFAEHGVALNCAVGYYARVTLTPTTRRGLRLHAPEGAPAFLHDDLLRAAARYFGVTDLEARITTDQPAGRGLGVTAAVGVALTAALAEAVGRTLSPRQIAGIAHRVHCEDVGRPCGVQQHMAAACGGVTLYHVAPYPRVLPVPISLGQEAIRELERRLLVVCTERQPPANLYGRLAERWGLRDRQMREVLWQLRFLPTRAVDAMRQADYPELGQVMQEQMTLQRQLYPALFTPEVQYLLLLARQRRALGVKVNGGGGSVTILCPPDGTAALAAHLRVAGYAVLPVRIARSGLRVWRDESTRLAPYTAPLADAPFHQYAP